MKNSDMKVIAIILSIALFFTILTSNAVSVASVILLAKDGVATEAPAGEQGGSTQQGGTTSTTPSGSTSTTPSGSTSTTPSGSTSTTPSGSTSTTPSGDSGSTDKPADDKPADNANDPIIADPLAAYIKAAKDIHENAVAGYKNKAWQAVEGDLQLSKFGFLSGTLTSLIKSFMTEESAAEEKVNEKGSDDAKNRMPISDISASYVDKATAVKEGDNYVVTIVLKDQVNPSYNDTDGLMKVSRDFLDMKDVINTVATDETVSKIVSKVDGTITYKAYTITAKMNAQGQFIDITHYSVAEMEADVSAVAVGDLHASGALAFNSHYYDFVY